MMSLATRTASLIGAPTDVGAGARGASMGPEAMRVAGLVEALRERGLDVIDRGVLQKAGDGVQPQPASHIHVG